MFKGKSCLEFSNATRNVHLFHLDLLHLLENTFDRKRIYANTSPNPNSNPNPFPKAQ